MNLEQYVEMALKEDLPEKDLTTDSLGVTEKLGRCRLLAKEDLVLSGVDFFTTAMKKMDAQCTVKWHFKEAQLVLKGQTVATISGNLIQILKAERVALNFLGHLSGVATLTNCFVKMIDHTTCQILDTRKTTPGFRTFEKKAVADGGGKNHRLNLSTGVMIKENHIVVAKGLKNAINLVRKNTPSPIVVEVKDKDEAVLAMECGAKHLLLDNMTNEQMSEIIKLKASGVVLEASGNMHLDRVKSVAELGVDFISVGALTHSAPTADFSLLFDW